MGSASELIRNRNEAQTLTAAFGLPSGNLAIENGHRNSGFTH